MHLTQWPFILAVQFRFILLSAWYVPEWTPTIFLRSLSTPAHTQTRDPGVNPISARRTLLRSKPTVIFCHPIYSLIGLFHRISVYEEFHAIFTLVRLKNNFFLFALFQLLPAIADKLFFFPLADSKTNTCSNVPKMLLDIVPHKPSRE